MAHPSANKDFSEMGRGDLVDYLALRGLSTSGRKIKLVALFGIKDPNNLHRRGDKYKTKQTKDNIRKDPLHVSRDSLIDDVTKWPSVDLRKTLATFQISRSYAEYIGKNKRHIPITKFGPLLFTLYIAPLQDVIARHNLNSLFYADDTQLCIAIDPPNQAPSLTALQTCIEDVMRWNTQNMLRSNAEKTEVILFTSRFTKTPNIEKLFFDSTVIELTEKVRYLGVILDKNLTRTYYISETCRKATNAIRSIRRTRKYLTNENLKLLINALVISRLDYCNSILYGLPKRELDKLQSSKHCSTPYY